MKSSAKNFLDENINPVIDGYDAEIRLIDSKIADSRVASEKLARLLKRTENLIGDIQACR